MGIPVEGKTTEQIAADQASVESSKVALTSAQQALALATLTSPVDGVVVEVNVVAGGRPPARVTSNESPPVRSPSPPRA